MNLKRHHFLLGAVPLLLLGMILYFKPHLILSGQMLYKIGTKRLRAADHGDYYDSDKVKSAIYYFENATKKGVAKRELFDKLSYCHLISNDNRNAEKILTIGIIHYPNDAEFYFDRANCRKDMRNFNGALLDYTKVIVLDKNFEYLNEAIYYRGAMRYILGDTMHANIDRQEAQKITDHELRMYSDYCQSLK